MFIEKCKWTEIKVYKSVGLFFDHSCGNNNFMTFKNMYEKLTVCSVNERNSDPALIIFPLYYQRCQRKLGDAILIGLWDLWPSGHSA